MTLDGEEHTVREKLGAERLAELVKQMTTGGGAATNTTNLILNIDQALDLNRYHRGPGVLSTGTTPADVQRLVDRLTPPDGPGEEIGQFWWKGKPYELPKKPWELLAFVWREKKQQASFAEAGEHVWGNDGTPDNTIRKNISEINNKLIETGIQLHGRNQIVTIELPLLTT